MTEQESNEMEIDNDSNAVVLGKKLQNLRESRGYSHDDVAGLLYLDILMVKALEAGDYRTAPSKTYVKGYIRNYIKIFDARLDFEDFGLYESDSEPVIIIPDTIIYNKKYAITKYIKIEYILVLISFLFLFAMYIVEDKYQVFKKLKDLIPFSNGI